MGWRFGCGPALGQGTVLSVPSRPSRDVSHSAGLAVNRWVRHSAGKRQQSAALTCWAGLEAVCRAAPERMVAATCWQETLGCHIHGLASDANMDWCDRWGSGGWRYLGRRAVGVQGEWRAVSGLG